MPARRLTFVHRVLASSRSRGFAGVRASAGTPGGATAVRAGGALHDAQAWVAGGPLAPPEGGRRTPNRVRAVPAALLAELAAALDAAGEGAWALAALRGRTSGAQRDAHLANLRDLLTPLRSVLAASW